MQITDIEKELQTVLPYAQIRFEGSFLSSGRLPAFRGATLRGAIGYELKRTVCHNHSQTCQDCIIAASCAYSYIFEGKAPDDREFMTLYPNIPQPFVLLVHEQDSEAIDEGDDFSFGMRLFGRAIEFFPYIAYAVLQMGQNGIGKEKLKYEIRSITQQDNPEPVYRSDSNSLNKIQKQYIGPVNLPGDATEMTVDFVTPLKIRELGKEVYQISFKSLLKNAMRRLSIMTYFYGRHIKDVIDLNDVFDDCQGVTEILNNTQTISFSRYSGRQKQKMKMSGIVGTKRYRGVSRNLALLLRLAEISHIGKATSFGFGQVKLSFNQE